MRPAGSRTSRSPSKAVQRYGTAITEAPLMASRDGVRFKALERSHVPPGNRARGEPTDSITSPGTWSKPSRLSRARPSFRSTRARVTGPAPAAPCAATPCGRRLRRGQCPGRRRHARHQTVHLHRTALVAPNFSTSAAGSMSRRTAIRHRRTVARLYAGRLRGDLRRFARPDGDVEVGGRRYFVGRQARANADRASGCGSVLVPLCRLMVRSSDRIVGRWRGQESTRRCNMSRSKRVLVGTKPLQPSVSSNNAITRRDALNAGVGAIVGTSLDAHYS